MRRPIARRTFLRIATAAAASGLLHRWAWSTGRIYAQPLPPMVEVLAEDLHLGPEDLAKGALEGVRATPQGLMLLPGRARGTYVSAAFPASFPLTHVGLHWVATTPAGSALDFEVRSSADGVAWSSWNTVLIEAHAGEAAGKETFGTLIRAQRANYLQFRATFVAGAGESVLRQASLTLLNAKDGPRIPRSTLTASTAPAPETAERVTFTREEWGADERLRFRGNKESWPRMYVPTKKVVVHHTATSNDYADAEDAKAEVRAIYTYHARTLGWGDIGYNCLVDKFGNSYEGRYGREWAHGREVLSEDVVAGHAASHNYGSTGVALLGTFCTLDECSGGTAPTAEMEGRLKQFLVWECEQHLINPKAASDFLLSNNRWNRNLANVCGHRDCNATLCPGGYVQGLLPSLRDYVEGQLANLSAPVVTLGTFPPEDTVRTGAADYAWEALGGAGGYTYSYYLEAWYKPSNSYDITYLLGFTDDKQPQWSDWVSVTSASFSDLKDGHYTFHVRARDANGIVSVYQDNRTLLMVSTGGGPGRRPR